jgi:hypothetical protein
MTIHFAPSKCTRYLVQSEKGRCSEYDSSGIKFQRGHKVSNPPPPSGLKKTKNKNYKTLARSCAVFFNSAP